MANRFALLFSFFDFGSFTCVGAKWEETNRVLIVHRKYRMATFDKGSE